MQPPDVVPEFDGALVRIAADDVEVTGLVLQGHLDPVIDHPTPLISLYDAAISVTDAWSGTRLHHNLFRLNTLGVELGSNGVAGSRVDHNCFRDNRYAVANQRYELTNGRIDDNTTFRTKTITFEVGWTQAGTTDVMVDHNVSHDDNFYVVYVDNSRRGSGRRQRHPRHRAGDPDQPGERGSPGRRKHRHGAASRAGARGRRRRDHRHQAGDDRARHPTNDRVGGWRRPGVNAGIGIQVINGAQPTGAVIVDNRRHGQRQRGARARRQGTTGTTISGNIRPSNGTNGIRSVPGHHDERPPRQRRPGTTPRTPATWRCSPTGVTPTSNQWVNTTCETDVPVGLICVPPVAATSAG